MPQDLVRRNVRSARSSVRASVIAATFLTLIVANLTFVLLAVTAPVESEVIKVRVRSAFDARELVTTDYLPADRRRGWHQYNDCTVLEMLSNDGQSRLERAFAPLVYIADPGSSQCGLLFRTVVEGLPPVGATQLRYARYWHGYAVVSAHALRHFELRTVRNMLVVVVWCAIGLLAAAAYCCGPRTRVLALAIAASAATVWAVPYFAPSLTHAPGDALLMVALAGLVTRPRLVSAPRRLAAFSTAFGAAVAFLEMLTGQLPIAAAWLFAVTLAAARDRGAAGRLPAGALACLALAAFGLGAAGTVAVKQLLAWTLVAPDAGSRFVTQLGEYMRVPDFEPGWPGVLEPFGRLANKSSILTMNSIAAGYGLVATTAALTLIAATRGWQQRHATRGRDVLMLVGASLIPVVWVLLLPTHTYIHAAFMVRMLVVPISLCPVAVWWSAAPGKELTRSSGAPRVSAVGLTAESHGNVQ